MQEARALAVSDDTSMPHTLSEAEKFFAADETCVAYLASRRWHGGARCPVCSSRDVRFLATRQIWECKTRRHARAQFSVRTGTLLEDSHLPLHSWIKAIWMIANSKKRISSYTMARELKITQKSAWLLLRRIACTKTLAEASAASAGH